MYTWSIKIIFGSLLALLFLTIAGCYEEVQNPPNPSEWKQVVDLSGVWKFSVGDNQDWAEADFNDDNWEKIEVPSSWENQGFHGYDGYGWYRNTFTIPERYKNETVYLFLGFIDDIDQVYINGKKVGFSGSFPPHYETAYNVNRRYPIASTVFNYGAANTISVRVYDDELEGGIVRGDIGFYVPEYFMENGINLTGTWKFQTGDDPEWKKEDYSDSSWVDLIVPGYWENQGFYDYDGYAWYRKNVFVPLKYKNKKLILVLGKIDDIDEAYINGKLVGSTGNFDARDLGDNYQKLRAYYLSENDFKFGETNLISVRVYDGFKEGGIYEGPVMIVPQKDYREYWNQIRRANNFIDKLFE